MTEAPNTPGGGYLDSATLHREASPATMDDEERLP